MTKPLVGSTYPTVTGENAPKGAAFARIVQELPGLQLWSVYYDGNDLPNWNGEQWFEPQYDHIRFYILSFKTSNVAALASSLAVMPEHLRSRVIIILHHEPDQWRSTSDRRGDPDPWVWAQRQLDFAELRAGSTWETWIEFWACFTEDRFRTAEEFWRENWGNWMLAHSWVHDGVFWDVFNIGRSIIRTPEDMFQGIFEFNLSGNWDFGVRELGQVVPTDTALDNQEVANAIYAYYVWVETYVTGYLRALLVWYYNHNNVFTDPSGNRPGRPLSLAAWQQALADAITPEESPVEPDPNHPQYEFGYQAGRDSRQSEVDDLWNEAMAQRQTILELQQAVVNAKAQGRLEAFGEVVNWAQGQS